MSSGFGIATTIALAALVYIRYVMHSDMYKLAAMLLLIFLFPVAIVGGLVVHGMRSIGHATRKRSPETR